MNLTVNQYIDYFSEHMALALGEHISIKWAYIPFALECAGLRLDLLHYLEDEISNGNYETLLKLHNAYQNFFPDFDAKDLEALLDDWINE